MILDGKEITSLEHLESLIVSFDDTTKTYLRNEYLGIHNVIPKKKFKITGSEEEPYNINLDSFPFFKERIYAEAGTSDNGRLIEVNHYRNCVDKVFSDLIVKEIITYVDGSNDFLESKKIDVQFYNEDNEIQSIQSKTKYYLGNEGLLESIAEGESRRKYLIQKGKLFLLGTIGILEGIALFTKLKNEVQQYEAVNNQNDLFVAINRQSLPSEIKTTLIYLLTY